MTQTTLADFVETNISLFTLTKNGLIIKRSFEELVREKVLSLFCDADMIFAGPSSNSVTVQSHHYQLTKLTLDAKPNHIVLQASDVSESLLTLPLMDFINTFAHNVVSFCDNDVYALMHSSSNNISMDKIPAYAEFV